MKYPFLTLDDNTEIVHSEMHDDGTVDVYVETPVQGGFHSAYCRIPGYVWSQNDGFTSEDIAKYQEIIESTAHLIIRYAQCGGFANASGL